ncbi:phosphatidate cytidylyltransferase [Tepidibacter formicigenes]|jgi:phosphatidate cytidylyltransferase|uniref:Phosphatidate cytidylyltransferase n=1 Tax=Tepidibacter formicigenes DSM 15518 TaxID=1123349 RepID=A0A1M6JBS6_9FIRM|nr:phosphatidate cytidylyltransferase [Tepidibacter formicigenes]SHJ44196.1 phosphatidate cytidylyltransferase [Tepidibacter formicigenes DSM 15518]
MFIRILSSIILLPVLIFILINGGIPLYLGVSVVSLIALKEFYDAFKEKKINSINIVGYMISLLFFMFSTFKINNQYMLGLSFILFFIACILVVLRKYNIMDMSVTFLGVIYIPYLLNHITLITNFKNYNYIWLVFIIAWMTDTFAYFSGYFFGKNKLIPEVSPKKTIEGSIGGIIGSSISCAVFGYLFNFNLFHMIIIGLVGSIVAQIGDLFASSIKRVLGIKDYGKLIPGHGGILDRFDSIIFTAPFVYYYILFFIK